MAGDPTLAWRKEQIRQRGINTAVLIAVAVVILRFAPITSGLFLFSLIENTAYDFAYGYAQADPPSDIVIIAIDDISVQPQHLGRFPWSREVYAKLLDKLPDARVVAFDVLLSEADAGDPESDEAFARAVREHGRVVLASYKAERVEVFEERKSPDWSYPTPEGSLGLTAIQPANFLVPMPELSAGAAATGYVDITPDDDGVFRRVDPIRGGYDGKLYPHFSTAIAQVASGVEPRQIVAGLPEKTIEFPNASSPISGEGAMLITYTGRTGTITQVPFHQVLAGETDPEIFRDKIVIVGATAPGLYDIRPAPYRSSGRHFFGVETNANIVDTLLRTGARTNASFSFAWAVFALALGLAIGWTAWSFGEALGPIIAALMLGLIVLPSFFVAFNYLHTVTPYGALLLCGAIPLAVAIPGRLGGDKRVVQGQFSAYVSPDVLRELSSDPELVAQGVRREVTFLFADVRGSTSLSENIEPEVWVAQLNEYLGQMSDAIFEHDGYLDKFMGDGIMAIWNTFGTQPDHASLAAKASLEMLRRLEILNSAWERMDNRTPFRIGVAIHTGEAIIGNVGSDERMQYTAIGDTVNTAARIEGLTKEYGVQFLASETSAAALAEGIVELGDIGEAEVRGRSEGIRLFARPDEYARAQQAKAAEDRSE